jgi:hypothetical protein
LLSQSLRRAKLPHLPPSQGITTLEALTRDSADGLCSFMRVPGSAAAIVAALQEAPDDGGGDGSLAVRLLTTLRAPILSYLNLLAPRPAASDEALAAWCAAALIAGALPALRRLMATERLSVHAASAASLLALIAAEPVAATGGAGDDGMPEGALLERLPGEAPRWRDDPAVEVAIEVLLGCVTGAPFPWVGAPTAPGGTGAEERACEAGGRAWAEAAALRPQPSGRRIPWQ